MPKTEVKPFNSKAQVLDFQELTHAARLSKELHSVAQKYAGSVIKSIKQNFIEKLVKTMCSNPNEPLFFAITGKSASGKSTLANIINKELGSKDENLFSILRGDYFYKDLSARFNKYGGLINLIKAGENIEGPHNFQLELMAAKMQEMKIIYKTSITENVSMTEVSIPKYVANGTGVSIPNGANIKPSKIMMVDGIATVFEPVSEQFDAKFYIEVHEDLRKERYFNRGKNNRNSDFETDSLLWKSATKLGEEYIDSQISEMDVIFNGNASSEHLENFVKDLYKVFL